MRRGRGNHPRYERIIVVGLFVTAGMFTTGSAIGAVRVSHDDGRRVDWGSVHVETTYAVAHTVANQIAWSVRGSRCPTPAEVGHPIDPWGHGYVVACADTIVVMSAGEDGRFGTSDDVVSQ